MIPEWTKKYIGLPFEKYNCWQIICKIYREQLSVDLPFLDDQYENHADKKAIKKIYATELARIWKRVNDPDIFSVVVFRIQGQLWHAGMVIAPKMMLHSIQGADSCIERYDSMIWRNRIDGFYNYAG